MSSLHCIQRSRKAPRLSNRAGSWVGEGTGTRLGFLHFSKAWEICGPSGNRCRPNLPAEPSSLHCRPLFLAFPRLATESPWPILGSAFARKRAVALLGSPFLRSLSNLSLRKPSGRYSGPSVQLLQTLPRSRPSPTLFSAGGVGGLATVCFLSLPLWSSKARHRVNCPLSPRPPPPQLKFSCCPTFLAPSWLVCLS